MARGDPCLGTSTVRASKAGFEPALPGSEVSDIFTTSVGLSRENNAANRNWSVAALSTARRMLRALEPALPSVSGFRLVPSGRPRALGHARHRASPGIRVSRSGFRRAISSRTLRTTKNPPEQLAREGPCDADCRSCRLSKIAPMSWACVAERHKAVR